MTLAMMAERIYAISCMKARFFHTPAWIYVNDIWLILALKMKSKESHFVRCEWR